MKEELLEKLYDAYDYLHIHNGYVDLIQRFQKDTEACKQKYLRIKNEKSQSIPIYLMIIFAAVVMLMIGGLIASQLNNYIIVYIILAGVFIAFCMANKYSKNKKMEPEKKAMDFWNSIGSPTCLENDKKIKKITNELNKFSSQNSHCTEFLPVDYKNDIMVVSYMIHVIENELAESIKEALHLYLEQKHRWEMESTMRGMAESMELHNREMESYMSEISAQQRITNSRLADIETLTFLDYINR